MAEMPIVRLTIESMSHTILHHLGTHHEEISEAVEAEIEKVLGNFDFEGTVAQECQNILASEIKSYFQYGDGSKAVRAALREGLKKIMELEDK